MSDRRSPIAPFWSGFLAGGLALGVLGGTFAWAATSLYGPNVAKVNGTTITESQLIWYMYTSASEDVVKDLVFYTIVAGEASKLGVTVDPAEADAVLQEFHKDRLDEVGTALDLTQVKAAILRQLTARDVLDAKRVQLAKDPKYAVTEEEIGQAYISNADKWTIPERVMISVINTKSLKNAESALTKLKGGTMFGEVAREFSEDEVSKDEGGKVDIPIAKGEFFRPAMKKVETAAFTLGVGKYSEVIQVADNYFIIQVDEKLPSKEVSIEEAREFLKEKIEDAKVTPAMREWLTQLGQAANLEVVYPIFTTSSEDLKDLNMPKDDAKPAAGAPGTPPAG